ncbi:MAG: response regulator, partial [Desulfobacula sp.]
MRILVIEDDLKISEFIQKGLKSSGFAVDQAMTGIIGFEMALDNPYDAMVVDIMLPEMDGISLIKNIRKENNNTPIIILSARDRV